jgi:uncharacterized phage protein gp47/JayE
VPLYIDAELITDETAMAEAILAGIADRLNSALGLTDDEGWQPSEGSPETALAEAVGILLATVASLIQDDERNDFSGFGTLVLGTPRVAAEPATGYTTWAFNATGTFIIPDGSELVLDAPDGTPVGFATVGDVTVTGNSAVDVQVIALEPGTVANGLSGAARDWEPLPFVTGVTMTTPTTGGTDEETVDAYLDHVVRAARRLKLVPIVTDDYADAALEVPAVARAVAVRLLDLTAPTTPPAAAGHITVFVADVNGNACSSADKTAVLNEFMGTDRPLNVTAHVGDPTYTNITVAISIRLAVGADHDATIAAVQNAITTYLSKATYGLDDTAPGRWRPPVSTAAAVITNYDVAAAADDVDGVLNVTAVTVNGAASVTLTGWAPLPNLTAPPTVTVVT